MLTMMSQIRLPLYCCYASSTSISETHHQVLNGNTVSRQEIRLGLPSKGRMSSDTLDLLKDCQLSVKQVNPRQYVAQIPQVRLITYLLTTSLILIHIKSTIHQSFFLHCQISNLEVWFQRPKDIVRKLLSGDLDLGIVGLDVLTEFGQVCIF